MIPCLIERMCIKMNKRAFTLIEVLIATAFSVVLILVVVTFYSVTRKVYSSGLSMQLLEDGANIVLSKIIEGKTEPGGVFRLAQAVSYCFGPGTNCTPSSPNQLYFIGTDGINRWYHLNNTSTSLLYHHPTAGSPLGADEMIYTAPAGATLTLSFWPPTAIDPNFKYPAADVGITVTLTQNTVTGSVSTLVDLRNHP